MTPERPEPETIVQPSLHTIAEYCDIVISEAQERGIDVSDLLEVTWIKDQAQDFINEALLRIANAGYAYIEQDDTLLIWPKGVEIPKEWRD